MGYFEPIPGYEKPCRHPEHNPPMHLYIQPGMQYVHICPNCGHKVVMRGKDVFYKYAPTTDKIWC